MKTSDESAEYWRKHSLYLECKLAETGIRLAQMTAYSREIERYVQTDTDGDDAVVEYRSETIARLQALYNIAPGDEIATLREYARALEADARDQQHREWSRLVTADDRIDDLRERCGIDPEMMEGGR